MPYFWTQTRPTIDSNYTLRLILLHFLSFQSISLSPGISLSNTGPLSPSFHVQYVTYFNLPILFSRPNTYTLGFFSNPFSDFNVFFVATNAIYQIGTVVAADAINKLLVAPFTQQIDDVIYLDQNRGLLQAKLKRMKLLLQDICNGFQNYPRSPRESSGDSLESTHDAIGEVKSLIGRSQLQQCCLDCIFCKPRISRQIGEGNTRFDQLHQELQTLVSLFASAHQIGSSLAQPPATQLLQPLSEWGIVGMNIKSAETRLQTRLMQATELRIIGVYGMGGIGKTTLVRSVYNSYKVSDVFDVVIWVKVSQDYKIRDLQGLIAKALDLHLSAISDLDIDALKMMLSVSLIKKKFLLILDDVWSPLDLQQALGVQFGDDKASKVVLSIGSRDLALTETKVCIEVEPLLRDEVWELFKRVAFK